MTALLIQVVKLKLLVSEINDTPAYEKLEKKRKKKKTLAFLANEHFSLPDARMNVQEEIALSTASALTAALGKSLKFLL